MSRTGQECRRGVLRILIKRFSRGVPPREILRLHWRSIKAATLCEILPGRPVTSSVWLGLVSVQDFVLCVLVVVLGVAELWAQNSHPLLQGHQIVGELVVLETVCVV